MAKEKKVKLTCPVWKKPIEFGIEHARNILELEKQTPAGIKLAKGEKLPPLKSNDADSTRHSEETKGE